MVSREPSALPLAMSACANTTSFLLFLRWGVEWLFAVCTHTCTHKDVLQLEIARCVDAECLHIFLHLKRPSRFTSGAFSHALFQAMIIDNWRWCGYMVMLATDGELLIDNGANRQKGVMYFFFFHQWSVFILSEQENGTDRPQSPWQWWHWKDGYTAGQRKVIYFRWPTRSSGLKLSLLIWLLLCLFPPTESTHSPAITANREGDGSKILSR